MLFLGLNFLLPPRCNRTAEISVFPEPETFCTFASCPAAVPGAHAPCGGGRGAAEPAPSVSGRVGWREEGRHVGNAIPKSAERSSLGFLFPDHGPLKESGCGRQPQGWEGFSLQPSSPFRFPPHCDAGWTGQASRRSRYGGAAGGVCMEKKGGSETRAPRSLADLLRCPPAGLGTPPPACSSSVLTDSLLHEWPPRAEAPVLRWGSALCLIMYLEIASSPWAEYHPWALASHVPFPGWTRRSGVSLTPTLGWASKSSMSWHLPKSIPPASCLPRLCGEHHDPPRRPSQCLSFLVLVPSHTCKPAAPSPLQTTTSPPTPSWFPPLVGRPSQSLLCRGAGGFQSAD